MSDHAQEHERHEEHSGGTVTHEMIAQRAYDLSKREDAGTPEENWARAEAEVRGHAAEAPE